MLVREIVVYVVVLIQFLLGIRIPPCRRRGLGVIVFVFSVAAKPQVYRCARLCAFGGLSLAGQDVVRLRRV